MKIVTKLKNGAQVVTQLSDRTLLASNGKPLTQDQLGKKLAITARAIAGPQYRKHRVVF